MAIISSLMRGIPATLHAAGSSLAASGTRYAIPPSFLNHKITIKTSAGVSAGAIQPESADVADYAGNWNPVGGGPINVPAASSEYEYIFQGRFSALGASITTPVVGGTIEVTIVSTP